MASHVEEQGLATQTLALKVEYDYIVPTTLFQVHRDMSSTRLTGGPPKLDDVATAFAQLYALFDAVGAYVSAQASPGPAVSEKPDVLRVSVDSPLDVLLSIPKEYLVGTPPGLVAFVYCLRQLAKLRWTIQNDILNEQLKVAQTKQRLELAKATDGFANDLPTVGTPNPTYVIVHAQIVDPAAKEVIAEGSMEPEPEAN